MASRCVKSGYECFLDFRSVSKLQRCAMDPFNVRPEWVCDLFSFFNSSSPVIHIYVDPKISATFSRHLTICRSNGTTLFLVSMCDIVKLLTLKVNCVSNFIRYSKCKSETCEFINMFKLITGSQSR
jgi:hypothetical protein